MNQKEHGRHIKGFQGRRECIQDGDWGYFDWQCSTFICVMLPFLFLHRKHLNPCLQHTLLLLTSWLFALSMQIKKIQNRDKKSIYDIYLSTENWIQTLWVKKCPKLRGSKFRPLRTFRDVSEELAASFLRVEQSANFYQITQDHVPNVFSHYHQAYFIKASPAVHKFK